jgi:poly(3-hydroxybutyrate) depolymerase
LGPNGNDLVIYEVHGGGHSLPQTWMGAPELLLGATNQDVNAMDEIWQFLSSKSR